MKRSLILMAVLLALPALASAAEEALEAKESVNTEETPKAKETPKTEETPKTKETPNTEETSEAARTFEVLGAKVCAGVENKECTAEQATFNTGDKAWLWLKLRPSEESATLSLRWSWNGEHVWTMDPVPVRLGRTWYFKTFDQPGEWQVELLDNNQTVLHTAKVAVSGQSTGETTGTTEASAGEAATADVAASEHVEVVDLKLAETIEDREPVSPTTTFAAGSKVYTWVKLNVKAPETAVKFKWYNGDALVYTSDPVNVKQSPSWRTWLYKTVDEAGAWKVEVVDADDTAIRRAEFTVQ